METPGSGGFSLPAKPTPDQVETAQLLFDQHRPDHNRECTTLTCAIGPNAVPWPCRRWRWAAEILRRAGHPVEVPSPTLTPA
jgi:hypothetical protein